MSKFQMKKLSLACGLALGAAGFASSASAVDLFLSGATAQDINLAKAVFDICDAAQPRTRINTTGIGSSYLCTGDATAGAGVAGQPVVVSKQTVGGSGNGIAPVSLGQTTLQRPSIVTVGCSTATDSIWTGAGVTVYTCPATSAVSGQAPHAGLSDVEPRLLGTAAQIANLASAGTVAVQFAPAVSFELYKKMQAAQGKIVGDPSEAQAPNLQPAELRGLLNGTMVDWTQLIPTISGNTVGAGTIPAATAVKLCRRGTTSGTQKTFEVRMLGLGCAGAGTANSGALNAIVTSAGDDFLNNNSSTAPTGTNLGEGGYRGRTDVYTVVTNNGSSDVGACMTAADGQAEMAVGLISRETVAPANWKFVKMGDVFPNLANMINGTWDNLWSQATFNRRLAPAGAGAAYLAAQVTLMNTLQAGIGNPANITGIPLLGVAGLPSNGFTWDGVAALVRGERRTAGGDVNNCQDALFQ